MENRNASDILLSLENKIDSLISIIKSQDLNIKILSNKLNTLLKEKETAPVSQNFKIESVDKIIQPNLELKNEESPQGFRRTSRPETYQGDNSYLPKKNEENIIATKFPIQTLNFKNENILSNSNKTIEDKDPSTIFSEHKNVNISNDERTIPVIQRIVNNSGKSVYMANVEIVSLETGKIEKTRTGPTGKWSSALKVGNYMVTISKHDAMTKEKFEAKQNIRIDGSEPKMELQTMIMK